MFIIKYKITNSIFSFVVSGFDVAGSASVGSGFDVAGSGFVGSGFDVAAGFVGSGFYAADSVGSGFDVAGSGFVGSGFDAAAGFYAADSGGSGFYAGFYFDFFDHQIDLYHLLEDLGQQNYHSLIGFGNFHLYC